ncbi:MAG: oligoendopeptidase F, partial [Planctomycetes bacterium]|nr:oligoendopeptidase F [Planctomycetota bacterium]
TDYRAKSSFIAPEIAKMDQAELDEYLQQEPGLKVYEFPLRDILRRKPHQLSAEGEKLIAETGMMASAPGNIYTIFANAELPFPEITLSDGTQVKLNQAGYARYRAVPNREDRQAIFDTFFGTFKSFRLTCGTVLASHVNAHVFTARARNYNSALQAALDRDNIPVEVYRNLVASVNRNLPTFYRYLRLKQRMLGVDQLRYSDLYASTVAEVDLKYSYEQAKDLVLDSVAPMGQDYVRDMRQAFDKRWIDVYPTPGKRSGAYMSGGAYDVHPFVLLNYNGQYDDVSTLAHELGHAMHSYYSNRTQPFPLADYATFVAEVASTLNEALLLQHVLETIDDDQTRLSLLMNYLDGVKGTLFRQTQFAEFELAIHERAENREPLTGDSLTEVYGDILRRYYGDKQGVCLIPDVCCVEWAYVPHFFRYDFYVYQFATSFTASTCLAERIQEHDPGAVADVMRFLSVGGSEYPIQILKDAGVDMTSPEPFDRTMAKMNRVMDQIEQILNKKSSTGESGANVPASNG